VIMESKVATFRLFVQHGRPLGSAEEERQLRGLFEKFGRVTFFATRRGEWRNSQVTFSSTAEAVKAKKELDKTRFFKGNSVDTQDLLHQAKPSGAGSRLARQGFF